MNVRVELRREVGKRQMCMKKRTAVMILIHSKEKMARTSKESSALINSLQEELSRVTQSRNAQQQNIRKLEQENDTLEQRERYKSTSICPPLPVLPSLSPPPLPSPFSTPLPSPPSLNKVLTHTTQSVDCIGRRPAR